MPLNIGVPLEKDFTLDRTDAFYGASADSPTRITIVQATQGAHEKRAQLFSNVIREMGNTGDDIVRLIQRFSMEELKRIECSLTLKACNIKMENGEFLFKFDNRGKISDSEFKKAWDLLPPYVAQEIHECVLDVNVDWNPSGEVS